MSTQQKGGRRPISEKGIGISADDLDFGNNMRLPQPLIDEITKKGLVYRFVDAKQLEKYGNIHKNGWVPYKADQQPADAQALHLGVSPDGYTRRGTLVLAVRSQALDRQHKAIIARRNALQRNVQETQAQSLRDMARAAGLKKDVVSEGYDEDQN